MRKLIILYYFILFSLVPVLGQVYTIKGKIASLDSVPIPYANIGIVGKPIGTVSDIQGKFSMTLGKEINSADTLRISHIGYHPIDFLIKNISTNENKLILLKKNVKTLKNITISSFSNELLKKGKDKENTKYVVNFSLSSKENQNLGSVIGRKFKFNSSNKNYISKVKFYIKQNGFNLVKFRLNFYNIKKGKPHKIINSQAIYKELKNKYKGWVAIDVSKYDIVIQKDIIIGIEWVEHSDDGKALSLPIIIPSIGSSHYYKYASQDKWKKFRGMSIPMYLIYEKEKK